MMSKNMWRTLSEKNWGLAVFAVLSLALLVAPPAEADVVNLNFVSVATGVDNGPQDGVFDSLIPNLGAVNNNGFTSSRAAFEFSLSGLPTGSTINSAQLTMVLSNFEGTRAIEVHGYAGDGTVQLSDFALNGLVATASVSAGGTQTFVSDVTSFVALLAANGAAFAGFNVREEPANTSNFEVMFLDLTGVPVLSIDFSAAQIVDIDIKPGNLPNSLNPKSKGRLPVAILTTDSFDATSVNPSTVRFGPTGTEAVPVQSALEDVDGDGDTDMILHFNTQDTDIQCGDASASLTGKTFNGEAIKGSDSINTVGCK